MQLYNIVSGKSNTHPTVEFNLSHVCNTRGNIYKLQLKHISIITYVNTSFVIELLQYGIVYLTLLFLQSLLIYLKIFWINSG